MTAIFFVGLAVLALLGHGFFWVAIVNRLHGLAGHRKLIDLATLSCLFAFLALPLLLLWNWQEVFSHWSAGWNETAGPAARYFQLCVVWCLGEFILKAAFAKVRNDPLALREWSKQTIVPQVPTDALLLHGAYANWLGRVPANQILQLSVEKKRIAIPRLHEKHAGLTIAHVSDFHMTGRVDRAWFRSVVEEVNRLEADVVAITGDIVENDDCLPWLAETVCRLEAKLGVYFILGNHDKYVETSRTRELLTAAGHVCLSGRWLKTQWHDAPVILAGNERPWLPEVGDLSAAPSRGPDHLPLRLFLLHTPDQIHWARQHDADLVLAGHTHGGQICFPLLGPVACPCLHGTRYTSGVYREGDCVMHVTRGLSGRTPLRWHCPPEIALLELMAEH